MTTKTFTLADFLRSRYDDEAEVWGGATGLVTQPQFAKLARGVLADIEAKRKIVALHDDEFEHFCPASLSRSSGLPCTTLRFLSGPYAGHAHYRPEWAK